jgi:xanthine dehydrogenase accessory factor
VTARAEVLVEAGRLAAEGKPCALATVVEVRRPASTRQGDKGLITPEGRLTGWVGGGCSEPIVVREALRALTDGRPRLVRIGPPGSLDSEPGVVMAESHCASEGVIDVLVEPQLPKPLLAVIGESPAARTLCELAAVISWRVSEELAGGPDAVVVATMGRMDADVLAAALRTEAGYIGLIASSRRAGVVLDELRGRGFAEEQLTRVHSPAGLDLGPVGQEEIAVAILAELVSWAHRGFAAGSLSAEGLPEAVDPVCGMTVATLEAGQALVHDGVRYWFCGPACRARFESDPGRYGAVVGGREG